MPRTTFYTLHFELFTVHATLFKLNSPLPEQATRQSTRLKCPTDMVAIYFAAAVIVVFVAVA